MHDERALAIDRRLKRIYPHLEPNEDHFAMAWRDLSLSDRAKVRDEESGEYQEQQAEEARLSRIIYARRGRGEGKQTMKHEQVGIFLKALHGVYADEDLTKSERGEVVADVLDDYADRTGGRDGLKDIASIPAARTATLDEPDLTKADTRHALAMTILEGKAEALRKVNPSLTREQAFAGPTRTRPMPKSRRSSAPQTRHASRSRRLRNHGDNIEKRCSSPSVTTRSTP